MGTENAKIWNCNYCESRQLQEGPRAMAMPPIPPLGWHQVSVVKLIPAHTQGGQKLGDQFDDVRKVVCPKCIDRLKPILEGS